MRYCTRCVTPETRLRISFDSEGVCSACRWAERKKEVDWDAKAKELKKIADECRSKEGGYDCIVPVSGGKDSTFQAHYAKNVLKLNTLCVNYRPSMPVPTGSKNQRNLIERIGVDHISVTPNPQIHRKLCKIMLKEHGNPFLPWVMGTFSAVTQIAIEKGIRMILYGENGEAEYGGVVEDTAGKGDFTEEGIRMRMRSSRPNWLEAKDWYKYGFPKNQLLPYVEPPEEEVEKAGIKRLFLSDFTPWNNNHNLHFALNVVGGFSLLDQRTVGTYTHGISIDDYLDDIYLWFLWPKFGFGRASKTASPDIREGKLTRERATELVKLYDGEFPWYVFDETLEFLDMEEDEFWDVVAKFVGDEENAEREKQAALDAGFTEEELPAGVHAWEKIGDRKWRHVGTVHGEERILELPLKRPK